MLGLRGTHWDFKSDWAQMSALSYACELAAGFVYHTEQMYSEAEQGDLVNLPKAQVF